MLDSGTVILLITLFASAICLLSIYTVYGNVIRHETTLHDLRNRVELLQNQQALKIAELKGEISPAEILEIQENGVQVKMDDISTIESAVESSDGQSVEIVDSSSTRAA